MKHVDRAYSAAYGACGTLAMDHIGGYYHWWSSAPVAPGEAIVTALITLAIMATLIWAADKITS